MFNRIIKGIEKRLSIEPQVREYFIENNMQEYIPTLDLAKKQHEDLLKILKPLEVVEFID
jgi:hypothetical protein